MENPSEQGPICPQCGKLNGFKIGEETIYEPNTQKPVRLNKSWKCVCDHKWTTAIEISSK
jgi:hypothetical protein